VLAYPGCPGKMAIKWMQCSNLQKTYKPAFLFPSAAELLPCTSPAAGPVLAPVWQTRHRLQHPVLLLLLLKLKAASHHQNFLLRLTANNKYSKSHFYHL